jgi:hypothetical protein
MSAEYNGLEFKTELEAIWAAFFDLAGWQWWCNPVEVNDWKPDFKVTFPCAHSECDGSHTILISVLPTRNLKSFKEHPSLSHKYGVADKKGNYLADGGALFGLSPNATTWEIAHGSGGGVEDVHSRVHNADELWEKAVVKLCK